MDGETWLPRGSYGVYVALSGRMPPTSRIGHVSATRWARSTTFRELPLRSFYGMAYVEVWCDHAH